MTEWQQLPKHDRRRIIREAFGGAAALKQSNLRSLFTRDKDGVSRLAAFQNVNQHAAAVFASIPGALALLILCRPMPLLCQSASKIDPLSACNIDPLSGTAEVVSVVNRGDPSGFV